MSTMSMQQFRSKMSERFSTSNAHLSRTFSASSSGKLQESTGRLFTRMTISRKAMDSGLNGEFVDTRRRLDDLKFTILQLKRSATSTKQAWLNVARQQRNFTQIMSNAFLQRNDVQAQAIEVERAVRSLQQQILSDTQLGPAAGAATEGEARSEAEGSTMVGADESENAGADVEEKPHVQMFQVLDRYLEKIVELEAQYKNIERKYVEKVRYEKKVDRYTESSNSATAKSKVLSVLRRKGNNERDEEKLKHNVEKLDEAKDSLEDELTDILEKMRPLFQNHQVVLQCAHHAFWMANHSYLSCIEQASRDVRSESYDVHRMLMDIDLDGERSVPPVTSNKLLDQVPKDGAQGQQGEDLGQDEHEEEPVEELLNIPDVPTETPKPPPRDGRTQEAAN